MTKLERRAWMLEGTNWNVTAIILKTAAVYESNHHADYGGDSPKCLLWCKFTPGLTLDTIHSSVL